MRRYVRVDLGKRENEEVDISLADARFLAARAHGFTDWQALTDYVASLPPEKTKVASRPVEIFSTEESGAKQMVGKTRDWDAVVALLRETRASELSTGEMTDALLSRISRLEHVTSLRLALRRNRRRDALHRRAAPASFPHVPGHDRR